ncbi:MULTISPECIES: hypothetical protein [unclassified Clostridium]|uniref:hypothetical protein n=1 Tax=unclassified Clostridium TaxID=2614128 RepID=UPI002A80D175|nr:hypothetical protein [Clostridium sp.]MDY4253758.1 hypothetical protein [Clostridium sp.]
MRISTKIFFSVLIYILMALLSTFEVIQDSIAMFLIFFTQSIFFFYDAYAFYNKDNKLFKNSIVSGFIMIVLSFTGFIFNK